MTIYNSVQDAYINSLRAIKLNGHLVESIQDSSSVGSSFGTQKRDFLELEGYSFVLSNPRNRLIYSSFRKPSFGFCVANFIWLLSGRNDVETISFYNKYGNAFSSNGIYYEAAFGDRIFGNIGLWKAASKLLAKDINTRRALMPLFLPTDLVNLPKDTPCASSVQVMIRNKKVDFFLNMRSQSAAIVLPYDIFLFTMLHEFISTVLNFPMGNFYYYCTSFHYYIEEASLVNNIILERSDSPKEMDAMCYTDDEVINNIVKTEAKIRSYLLKQKPIGNNFFNNMPSYWRELMQIVYYKGALSQGINPVGLSSAYLNDNNLFI